MPRVRLTRSQKLDRKGIFHIEADGVLAYLSKKHSGEEFRKSHRPLLVAMQILAVHIRDRVKAGWFADGTVPAGYASDKHMNVSEAYSKLAGTPFQHRGWWKSSAEFHAAAHSRAGTGWVTGGMWGGVQVVEGTARDGSVGHRIEFNQQYSESSGRWGEAKAPEAQRGRTGAEAIRYRRQHANYQGVVKNREKAKAVFDRQHVNPVEFRQAEVDAIASGLLIDLQRHTDRQLGVQRSHNAAANFGGDPVLMAKLTAGWR
jgi:hypothetical protein